LTGYTISPNKWSNAEIFKNVDVLICLNARSALGSQVRFFGPLIAALGLNGLKSSFK